MACHMDRMTRTTPPSNHQLIQPLRSLNPAGVAWRICQRLGADPDTLPPDPSDKPHPNYPVSMSCGPKSGVDYAVKSDFGVEVGMKSGHHGPPSTRMLTDAR